MTWGYFLYPGLGSARVAEPSWATFVAVPFGTLSGREAQVPDAACKRRERVPLEDRDKWDDRRGLKVAQHAAPLQGKLCGVPFGTQRVKDVHQDGSGFTSLSTNLRSIISASVVE